MLKIGLFLRGHFFTFLIPLKWQTKKRKKKSPSTSLIAAVNHATMRAGDVAVAAGVAGACQTQASPEIQAKNENMLVGEAFRSFHRPCRHAYTDRALSLIVIMN